MGAKLEDGMYKDRFGFQEDFRLMVSNAKRYNMPSSFAHNEAIALEIFFEKRTLSFQLPLSQSDLSSEWAVINKTLEAADKARPVPVAVNPKPDPRKLPPVPKAFPSLSTDSSTIIYGQKKTDPTPAAPRPSVSRPTIKLKVASQDKASEPSQQEAKSRKKAKLAVSPSSLVLDAPTGPPPPYVDDGSHDILQEVLAIEREKEQRQRAQLEKDRSSTVVAGKRKQGDIDEDEILQLATPSKKERPSSDSSAGKPQTIPLSTNSRPSIPPVKMKKEKLAESSRSAGNHSPVPSLKGKEKEVIPPDNLAKQSKQRKTMQGTPLNEKKCKELLKTLLRVPESLIFRQPVDPIRDGCPT